MGGKGAVILTGGASKVSSVLAVALAEAGFDLFITYNNSFSRAEVLRRRLVEEIGVQCVICRADLRDITLCGEIIERAFDLLPQCNTLINSASVFRRVEARHTSWEFLEENFRIHMTAPFVLSNCFMDRCVDPNIKYNIINVTDHMARGANSAFFAYSLSKNALLTASELMKHPLCKVTALCPKPICSDPENIAFFNKLTECEKTSMDDFIRSVLAIVS